MGEDRSSGAIGQGSEVAFHGKVCFRADSEPLPDLCSGLRCWPTTRNAIRSSTLDRDGIACRRGRRSCLAAASRGGGYAAWAGAIACERVALGWVGWVRPHAAAGPARARRLCFRFHRDCRHRSIAFDFRHKSCCLARVLGRFGRGRSLGVATHGARRITINRNATSKSNGRTEARNGG